MITHLYLVLVFLLVLLVYNLQAEEISKLYTHRAQLLHDIQRLSTVSDSPTGNGQVLELLDYSRQANNIGGLLSMKVPFLYASPLPRPKPHNRGSPRSASEDKPTRAPHQVKYAHLGVRFESSSSDSTFPPSPANYTLNFFSLPTSANSEYGHIDSPPKSTKQTWKQDRDENSLSVAGGKALTLEGEQRVKISHRVTSAVFQPPSVSGREALLFAAGEGYISVFSVSAWVQTNNSPNNLNNLNSLNESLKIRFNFKISYPILTREMIENSEGSDPSYISPLSKEPNNSNYPQDIRVLSIASRTRGKTFTLDVVTAAGVLKLDGLTGRFIHHFPIPPYSPSNIPNKLVPYVLGSVNAHLKTKDTRVTILAISDPAGAEPVEAEEHREQERVISVVTVASGSKALKQRCSCQLPSSLAQGWVGSEKEMNELSLAVSRSSGRLYIGTPDGRLITLSNSCASSPSSSSSSSTASKSADPDATGATEPTSRSGGKQCSVIGSRMLQPGEAVAVVRAEHTDLLIAATSSSVLVFNASLPRHTRSRPRRTANTSKPSPLIHPDGLTLLSTAYIPAPGQPRGVKHSGGSDPSLSVSADDEQAEVEVILGGQEREGSEYGQTGSTTPGSETSSSIGSSFSSSREVKPASPITDGDVPILPVAPSRVYLSVSDSGAVTIARSPIPPSAQSSPSSASTLWMYQIPAPFRHPVQAAAGSRGPADLFLQLFHWLSGLPVIPLGVIVLVVWAVRKRRQQQHDPNGALGEAMAMVTRQHQRGQLDDKDLATLKKEIQALSAGFNMPGPAGSNKTPKRTPRSGEAGDRSEQSIQAMTARMYQ